MKRLVLLMLMYCCSLRADLLFSTYRIPSWPPNTTNPGTVVSTGTVPNLNYNWGSGVVLNSGLADQVLVHFTGYIVWPGTAGAQKTVNLYAATDDGFKATIDGNTVINDIGGLHGPSNYNYSTSLTLTGGQVYSVDIWWAEWGGGAVAQFYWNTGSGIVIIPSTSLLTTYTPTPIYSSSITGAQQTRVSAYFARTISNNSVYIDQVGSYNRISVAQVGRNNLLTGVNSQDAAVWGNHNNITVRQGDQSNDNGRNEIDLKVQGDYNTVNLNQALDINGTSVNSTSGHYQLASVVGNSNSITTQQTNNGSGNHYLENNISGNNNAITEYQLNNGNKLLFVAVNGNSNSITTTQQGTGNHYLDINLTGDSNSVTATQTGSQSHKATINLTNAGGPASLQLNQNSSVTGLVYSISQSCTTPAGCSVSVTQP